MVESGMDSCFFLWRTPITSYEIGDEPSGFIKGRALATNLVTVSFLTEVVMHGINLVITRKASSVSNEQNDVFRLLWNVYNDISARNEHCAFLNIDFCPRNGLLNL